MKTATPWTEEVLYAECPYCEETNELGEGVVWNEGEEVDCTRCGQTYKLTGATK